MGSLRRDGCLQHVANWPRYPHLSFSANLLAPCRLCCSLIRPVCASGGRNALVSLCGSSRARRYRLASSGCTRGIPLAQRSARAKRLLRGALQQLCRRLRPGYRSIPLAALPSALGHLPTDQLLAGGHARRAPLPDVRPDPMTDWACGLAAKARVRLPPTFSRPILPSPTVGAIAPAWRSCAPRGTGWRRQCRLERPQ